MTSNGGEIRMQVAYGPAEGAWSLADRDVLSCGIGKF